MWFSDMLCNLHVWYLQSEVLYILASSHSKSRLSWLCYAVLFLHETERLLYKNTMHSFIVKCFKDNWCPHTSQPSIGHDNNMKKTRIQLMTLIKKSNSLFFSPFPLIDMLAQLHSTKTTKSWNWNYGKKDITALKAILLLSLFQCLLWHLHVCVLRAKSTAGRDPTWEEVDMCAGSVGLIQLLWY